jgi:septum formation protein
MEKMTFILASSSPRRIEMLKKQGYRFKVVKPLCSEVACHIRGARGSALHNSKIKALYVEKLCDNAVILSADTVVVLNNRILGKPKDTKDALRMLKELNNKTHSVLTAYTVLTKKNGKIKIIDEKIVESKVSFGNFTDKDYAAYVRTKEPLDKTGAYAVQGLGARFVKEVKGSYSNVVGLPLFEVINSLKKAGVKALWK